VQARLQRRPEARGFLKSQDNRSGSKADLSFMFSKIGDKGFKAQITTDDKGKIGQILVLPGKKSG
jgi:hypothetical protein